MTGSKTKRLLGMILLLTVLGQAMAQQTVIQGVVTDAVSQRPLQYVSVVFKGGRGTVTDSLGHYTLRSSGNNPTIQASYVGYKTILKTIVPGTTQTVDISLET